MAFDIETIYTLIIIINIVIAIILIFYKSLISIKPSGLYLIYALGKFLQAAGLSFLLFREELPGALFIILTNIFLYFGFSLEFFSFSAFGSKQFIKKLRLFLVLASISSVVFALNVHQTFNIRIFISFIIFTFMGLIAGINLITIRPKSKIKGATGIMLICFSFVMLFRSADALISHYTEALFLPDFAKVLVFIVYFVTTFVLTISFVFLKKEEDVQSLLNNSELLTNIIDNLPIGLEMFDVDGFCSDINKSMQDILGLPKTENVVGKFNILTDPFSKANGTDKRYQKVFAGESINHVLTIDFGLTENGFNTRKDKRILQEIVFPIFDKNHQVSHVIALIWDLTDIRNKENELKQSQDKFKLVFESSPIGKALLDSDGKVLLINKKVISLFGYTIDEIPTLDEWYNKAFPSPDLRATIKSRWEQYKCDKKNNQEGSGFEVQITARDGGKKHIQLNYEDIGDLRIITFIDITERKKNVEEIQRIKELLAENERLFDVGAWEYNVETKEIFWSDGLYNIHDFDKSKEVNHIKESLKCYSDEDRIKIEKAFSDCITKGKAYTLTCRFTSKKGSKKWIRTITKPVFDKNQQVQGIIGVVVDISEHILTENKLKELNATKDKLFSIIGHDLRNPLGNLIQLTDLLIDKTADIPPDTLAQYIKMIKSSSEKSLELLNNLLDWSRISIGSISLDIAEHNIHAIIEEISAMYQPTLINKNISFINSIPKDHMLKVDEKMIQTVFRNLISNAIKFTPQSGRIEIQANTEKGYDSISISDNGVGMSKTDIEKLYNPSEFITKNGTNSEQGSGLGIKLCQEFIHLHKGSLKIESEINKGSTFSVCIPQT